MDRERLIAAGGIYDASLLAPGGWYTPVFDEQIISRDVPRVTLPEMSASRGGIDFTDRRTDAERAADDAMRSHVTRLVEALMRRERDVIDRALLEALANGWDVNVYRQPWHYAQQGDHFSALRSAYIGIGFTPAKYSMPTLREHLDHDWSELDDDEVPTL